MISLFQRCSSNPILTADDLPEKAGYYVLNPGAVKFNGEYILLADVFHTEGGIIFWTARSADGIRFKFDSRPADWASPDPETTGWHENGVYDPRITRIGDEFIILYGSHDNRYGTRIAVAKTRDFIRFEHVGLASEINNRNAALFPEKIGGKYCRFERPFGGDEFSPCDMWLSFSDDLKCWGGHRASLQTRRCHWDHLKIGAGAPPIRIEEGWLEIYHGVNPNCDGTQYMLFAAILDYREPWKVIARSKSPILFPEAPYETAGGRVRNVVFTCNAILEENNLLRIYYGAQDTAICMAEAPLDEVVKACQTPYRYLMNQN